MEDRTVALAQAVRARRRRLGLSLDELAGRSSVSKGALVALENGDANPTFGTIVRVADALQTPVSSLFEAPETSAVRVIAHASKPMLWQGMPGSFARLLLTVPGPVPVEYWSWHLQPGDGYVSHPHPAHVQEVITVISGALLLTVDGAETKIPAHGTAYFWADKPHAYAATHDAVSFLMQVHLPASHGSAEAFLSPQDRPGETLETENS